MLLDTILLHCVIKLKGERSTNATYHILTGKKSIQTIQDIYLFDLENVYGIYKNLRNPYFIAKLESMVQRGLLEESTSNSLVPTEGGSEWYMKNGPNQLRYFQGSTWYETSKPFMLRLQLLIQVLANSQVGNKNYVPVIEEDQIEKWVKRTYQMIKSHSNIRNVSLNLYNELHHLLQTFSEEEATMFVSRLSGYDHYGMSLQQLASKHHTTVSNITLLLERIIHRMLSIISDKKQIYPTLYFVINDLTKQSRLTHSARITYKLLNKQYTLEKIASLRRLSQNTIQDHIVEITIYDPCFSIDSYVEVEKQKLIIQAVNDTSVYKLKTIKANVPNEISYFQIRLVLARLSQLKEEIKI